MMRKLEWVDIGIIVGLGILLLTNIWVLYLMRQVTLIISQ